MGGTANYTIPDMIRDVDANDGAMSVCPPPGDMNEVMGQETAKWALEVAAAGGHHLMMTGPPGTGKTMLASRIPGIMSPLSESEQLEVASIRSLCGTLPSYGISDVPPFEAPHHTASTASLVGGGTGLAQPGAITRAHRGILFMDEAPEFSARTLQTLREPLESGYVAISRAKGTTYYPARFQLIMAANPCPCGYAYGNGERCTCREKDRIKYFSRLSGPILDRIDIQIEVLLWNASTQARFLPANPATPSACGSWWQGKRHRNVSGNSDGSAMRKPPEHGFAPTRPQKPSSS